MTDRDKTEYVLAKILQHLSERGVRHGLLTVSDLMLDKEIYGNFFGPCLKWLEAEGLIRTNEIVEYVNEPAVALDPCLTSIGMNVLEQEITVGNTREKLSETVEKVSNEQTGLHKIGDLISGILGGFTKSIGS